MMLWGFCDVWPRGQETELTGYILIKKAIGLREQDPEMEFAAALVTLKE